MSLILALAAGVTATCSLPVGFDRVAAQGQRYVIFGEMHGTEQSPAMLGETACALARQGKRVLVAIEFSVRDNAALQAAWRGPRDGFAERLLSAQADWKERYDGRASKAMLATLDRLHALKSDGLPIAVVAFNGARDADQIARFKSLPGQEPHEAAQAENIRIAADAASYDQVLVLVGGLHASKQPVERGGVAWRPMAMHLAPANQVVSLNMAYGAGTIWGCRMRDGYTFEQGKPMPPDAIRCAPFPTRSSAPDGEPRVGLGPVDPAHPDPSYDGFYYVGPVTAAPPAIASEATP